MSAVLITYVLISLILMLIAVPLIRRRFKPDYLYGYRLRRVTGDLEKWYQVTRYLGWLLLGLGAALALTDGAIYLLFPTLSARSYTAICSILLILGLAFILILGWRYLLMLSRPTDRSR